MPIGRGAEACWYDIHRMSRTRHTLVHGLSIGSGGGFTVGRELWHHLAACRPNERFTLSLIAGHPLHEELRDQGSPANAEILWVPSEVRDRIKRQRYEAGVLTSWMQEHHVDAAVSLNGMIIPRSSVPILCHFQDPWPYRRQAWGGLKDRVFAALKRRRHRRSLRQAQWIGWTSEYLRDLICHWHQLTPTHQTVFYNGVPEAWLERLRQGTGGLEGRPMEIVTVSNVGPYKRQELVIRALPRVVERFGLKQLVYRIVGHVAADYRDHLVAVATELGVSERVIIEGRVSDERVQTCFANARCFVLMSVCESFGIPAIEAMSYGTPVVTADCCAMPEVCADAAALCPVDDVDQLAQSIGRVLTDAGYAAQLRAAGARNAARFSWPGIAACMTDCLDQIVVPSA